MMNKNVQFFYDNAGYSYPAGSSAEQIEQIRIEHATKLLETEEKIQHLIDKGLVRFNWEYDEGYNPIDEIDFENDEQKNEMIEKLESGYLSVRVLFLQAKCSRCGQWETIDILCGIISSFDVHDTYPRILQAEMVLENYDRILDLIEYEKEEQKNDNN